MREVAAALALAFRRGSPYPESRATIVTRDARRGIPCATNRPVPVPACHELGLRPWRFDARDVWTCRNPGVAFIPSHSGAVVRLAASQRVARWTAACRRQMLKWCRG